MSDAPKDTAEAEPLESSMRRLEDIIGQMDDEDLSLDELLRRYQEGSELLTKCRGQISEFRDRVEKITKSLEESGASVEPFEVES